MTIEIVFASGKGGTGKTFLSSNFLYYLTFFAREYSVGVDADVEAPDLALALGGFTCIKRREPFAGSWLPVVDYAKCIKCWRCVEACKFSAIKQGAEGPVFDYDKCEGLGTCSVVCPVGAISMKEKVIGEIVEGVTATGIHIVTGFLSLGGSSSGRLVYELKERAREMKPKFVVVDAAPGIGCPVVSSLSGANLLVVAVEPTPQSVKGAKRLLHVAEMLKVKPLVVLNKADLNPQLCKKLEEEEFSGLVIGSIPFDKKVLEAYASMKPLLLYSPESPATKALVKCFEKIIEAI